MNKCIPRTPETLVFYSLETLFFASSGISMLTVPSCWLETPGTYLVYTCWFRDRVPVEIAFPTYNCI